MTRIYKQRYPSFHLTLQIQADFSQAADNIRYRTDDDEDWRCTPFQVASFQHRPRLALTEIHKWAQNVGV